MKLIRLTSISTDKPVYVNVECIGHLFKVEAKVEYGKEIKPAYTKVGVTTHNNGGFEVAEDIDQIVKLIEKSK